MRFIQITDTHLGSSPDFIYHGVNSYQRVSQLIDTLNGLPFQIDFVLHTGDVVDSGTPEEYQVAHDVFARLRYPIHFAVGNHDVSEPLQRHLIGIESPQPHYDYSLDLDGLKLIVLDSNGGFTPSGKLEESQLVWLREQLLSSQRPILIAMHHPAVTLDTPWIDRGWSSFEYKTMLLTNHSAFREAIAPARGRIKGVLFGHVHRAFQVFNGGIPYIGTPSAVFQHHSFPDQLEPMPSPTEQSAYSIITYEAIN